MTEIKKICSRRTEVIEINGKEVIFKAISLGQLRELAGFESFKDIFSGKKKTEKKKDESLIDYLIRINDLLKLSCGLDFDDLAELDGQQLQEVYEIFKDVNSVFFGIARNLEINKIAEMGKGYLLNTLQKLYAYYSAKAMQTALSTDMDLQSTVIRPLEGLNEKSKKTK